MHHAPAGPPLSARVAGILARLRFRAAGPLAVLGAVVGVMRRTRVLSVALGGLVLAAFAMAAPIAPYDDDDAASTAALRSTSDGGRELVPATGDGWTQDGVPAGPSVGDEESRSSSSATGSPSGSSAATVDATDSTVVRTGTGSSAPSPEASAARTSPSGSTSASSSRTGSSSSSPRPPSSGSDGSESPSGTPSAPSETEAPALEPAVEVLAAVNDARTAAGCAALTPDAGMASLATEHSAAMRDGGFVAVQSPDGGSPLDRGGRTAVVAEGRDPDAVADGWLADATLLDCGLTRGGVGTTGGYWTLLAA